jgi:hypothetical protein
MYIYVYIYIYIYIADILGQQQNKSRNNIGICPNVLYIILFFDDQSLSAET